MMVIFPVPERDEKTRVRDRLHLREKPLRIERSLGPAIAPAQRRNGRLAEFRAFSSSSRTMRPMGISYRLSAAGYRLRAAGGYNGPDAGAAPSMRKRYPVEDALNALSELRRGPISEPSARQIGTFLGNRSNLVVAKAAKIAGELRIVELVSDLAAAYRRLMGNPAKLDRSEEHTSELQSLRHLVCRLLL